jgi:UDP-N-acetyl-D-glucosamine dehydrogenase
MKISVLGQGYVGLPLARRIAEVGYKVVGFDTDSSLIETLVLSEKNNRNYLPTSNQNMLKDSDIYIIAVPTPLNSENLPDFSYLKSASLQIGQVASHGALIVNESTSYPGTLREIVKQNIEGINQSKLLYAAAPERIDPTNTIWSIKNTPRIVAGLDLESTKAVLNFYESFCDQVTVVSMPEVAEAAKLFENTFRQVNIALVNEFAQIAEKFGFTANEVISAAATKPFGFMKFSPSLGVGGHCIPIDPIYLGQKAESLGATAAFIKQATKVNQQMPSYIVTRLQKLLGEQISGKRVCIVGLSYKSDTADLRQSPSISLWNELESKGCLVSFHDEVVGTYNGIDSALLEKSAFDLAVVGVRHTGLDIKRLMESANHIFDCTGTISGLPTL